MFVIIHLAAAAAKKANRADSAVSESTAEPVGALRGRKLELRLF
jgi:hypothetical protein